MIQIMLNATLKISKTFVVQSRYLASAVRYSAKGKAANVYKLEEVAPPGALAANEVSLKILAAPINPADINMAEGVYGIKRTLPATGGLEGVAVVEKIGSEVKSLESGDWVIPYKAQFGTWAQHATADESLLLKVPNDIPEAYAATLSVNPATAYRMLRDFEKLKPGDVVVQNGANSMVGLAVIQLAREMGIKTINVVRSDRPNVADVIKMLTNLGGDVNITDKYLNTAEFNEIMADLPPCKLALNCVGGEVTTDMARVLAPNATMVTYGGMSKQPLTIPYDLLTYKGLNLRGFWMSKWYLEHTPQEASAMLEDIAAQIRADQLRFFFRMHDLDDFPYALEKAEEPFNLRKIVLNLNYPDRMQEHDNRDPKDYKIFEAPVV